MLNPRRQKLWLALLMAAAIIAVFMSSVIVDWIAQHDKRIVSSRTVGGVLLGQIVGLRRRTLLAFIIAPLCGLIAGITDIKMFVLLYESLEFSIRVAGMVPVWGFTLGLLVAAYQVNWQSSALVLFVVTISDFVARWSWATAYEYDLQLTGDWLAITEAAVFVPTAILVIALTRPARQTLRDVDAVKATTDEFLP